MKRFPQITQIAQIEKTKSALFEITSSNNPCHQPERGLSFSLCVICGHPNPFAKVRGSVRRTMLKYCVAPLESHRE